MNQSCMQPTIQLAKDPDSSCTVCQSDSYTIAFKGKHICQHCISAVKSGDMMDIFSSKE